MSVELVMGIDPGTSGGYAVLDADKIVVATSVFTFGDSWGFLRGLLVASAASREYVRPQKWQKIFSLPTTKQCGSKTAKKNANKAEAQRQFPAVKMTHAIADALLIAEYARRVAFERVAV